MSLCYFAAMSFFKASLRPLASIRPSIAFARPQIALVAPIQFRSFHMNNFVAAKAQKGASGKKKKKEEFELPKDLTMDKIAADWFVLHLLSLLFVLIYFV